MADERFAYSTDETIGLPGFYRHNEDGSLDTSIRYRWVDDAPEDPADSSGHFEPAPVQYVLTPAPTVQLTAEVHGVGRLKIGKRLRRVYYVISGKRYWAKSD